MPSKKITASGPAVSGSSKVFGQGTLGASIRELALPGIYLTETRFRSRDVLPWHAHELARFSILLHGTYVEAFRSNEYTLGPLDLIFKPNGIEHQNRYGEAGSQGLLVEFDQAWIEGLRSKGMSLDAPWFLSRGEMRDASRRLYSEFIEPDDVSGLAVEIVCIEIILQASRRSGRSPAAHTPLWLHRVRDMLHDQWRERVTLEQLAQVADVHPVHLAQTFRRVCLCTIGEYVRNLRVSHAAEHLAHTDEALAEIAISCGFYDQSHLSRVFKKQMHVTPAQYRRAHGSAVGDAAP
jgi:AraC family transcriptional regulator